MNSILFGLENASYGFVVKEEIFYYNRRPQWKNDIPNLDNIEYALPNVSNMENGLGYMFGILNRSIPHVSADECVDFFNTNDYLEFGVRKK